MTMSSRATTPVTTMRFAEHEVAPVSAEDAGGAPLRIRWRADVLEPVAKSRHACPQIGARQVAKQPLELGPDRVPSKRLAALVPGPAPLGRPVVDLPLQRAQVGRHQAGVVLAHGEVETARRRLGRLGQRMEIPVDIARHRERQRRRERPIDGQEHRHEPAARADVLNNGQRRLTRTPLPVAQVPVEHDGREHRV
jgi:hypothetical protein